MRASSSGRSGRSTTRWPRAFAHAFYDGLLGLNGQEPQTVGEAFQAARQAIKAQDPDNPTWLAYVLYGDPNGRVVVETNRGVHH